MQYNIAFYVHHHGSGHLTRSLAIAKHLEGFSITFLGSDLQSYASQIPGHISCINLPMDVADEGDSWAKQRHPHGLHYAPLNLKGQVSRVAIISKFFSETTPLLLVVDVSVEVAMLATLCGVPTIVMRQHGNRTDEAHLLAYQNALGLIAPYGKELQPAEDEWLSNKTFFAGGFSRYSPQADTSNAADKLAAIFIGRGGSSINHELVHYIAAQLPDWRFQVIGAVGDGMGNRHSSNVNYHGQTDDPKDLLMPCCVVIGNAGNNTVMEIASLGKRMILIPEHRPFEEQEIKAGALEKIGLAEVVRPQEAFEVDWAELIGKAIFQKPDWSGVVRVGAVEGCAQYLKARYKELYL